VTHGKEKNVKALLSIREFSERFGVSRSTIYRLKQKGEISFVHVGKSVRIPAAIADAWCASLTATPPNDN